MEYSMDIVSINARFWRVMALLLSLLIMQLAAPAHADPMHVAVRSLDLKCSTDLSKRNLILLPPIVLA
jgi:hypothetical protein